MKKIVTLLFVIVLFSCKETSKKELKETPTISPIVQLANTELASKTAQELRLLRNEIFARKGYVFKNKELNHHFGQKEWYTAKPDTIINLSEEEKSYIDRIKGYELTLSKEKELELIQNEDEYKIDSIVNADKATALTFKGIVDTTYTFSDTKGKYELVLTKGEFKKSLYAYCKTGDSLQSDLRWKLRDFIDDNENATEEEISFIKYATSVVDLDVDGLVDPILVYTTKGYNGYKDTRLKIIIRYKDKKIGIRHQNAASAEQRVTKIDPDFQTLPKQIKTQVKNIMKLLESDKYAIFGAGVFEQIEQ